MNNNKILIIEDNEAHYEIIHLILEEEYNFEIYPKSFSDLSKILNRANYLEEVNKYIDKITPIAIICDINLFGKKEKGINIIKYIRKEYISEKYSLLGPLIPIIAFTEHSDMEVESEKMGAVSCSKYFDLNNDSARGLGKQLFIEKLRNQIRHFEYVNRQLKNRASFYEEHKKLLEEYQQVIIDKIGDVEIVIQNNHSETTKMLQTLFLTSFKGLDSSKQDELVEEYKKEIREFINNDEIFDKIKETKWERFKGSLKEVVKGGSIEAFTNTAVDMLEEVGVFKFPGGKILSIGIKGIVSIASK